MIKALILDDDTIASRLLHHLLEKFFSNKILVVSNVSTIDDALRDIRELNPELLFLDINIGQDSTSFDLLKNLDVQLFDIIFLSSNKDYAFQAIRHGCIDYLLKPLDSVSLLTAVKRYITKSSQAENYKKIKMLLDNLEVGSMQSEKVAFPVSTGFKLVNLSSIKYCEADVNYCTIHLNNNKKFIISKTLKYVEHLLPSNSFVRIHKSFLVNKHFIVEYNKNEGGYVFLVDGVKLPVSNRKKNIINQFFR